jgi:hypothetical protein
MRQAILSCLSDKVEEPDLFPTPMLQTYKPEIEKSLQLKPSLFPYTKCSSFYVDPKDPHLAPAGTRCIYWHFKFPAHELSCFDRKLQKPSGLSDAIWIATSLSIATLGNAIDTLAIPVIVDLRRYISPSRLNNTCLNNVGSAILAVKTSPNMTMIELGEKFRADFARIEQNMGIFFSTTRDDYWVAKPGYCYGNTSNLGPLVIKPPLKDFYLKTTNSRDGIENQIFLFAFSKVTPTRNELCGTVRFSPTSITVKKAHIVTESIKHFLTTIPMNATPREAHREIQAFQGRLDKEY